VKSFGEAVRSKCAGSRQLRCGAGGPQARWRFWHVLRNNLDVSEWSLVVRFEAPSCQPRLAGVFGKDPSQCQRVCYPAINAMRDVCIFGYQSILTAGSLATSIATSDSIGTMIPARLPGYVRSWDAVRDFATNVTKRYVHVSDWRRAERAAFANLRPAAASVVNGVCRRVDSDKLPELDFREQGYTRVDISNTIAPYDGFELGAAFKCYAYVDPTPDMAGAMVSRAYYEMGRRGASRLNDTVPGFSDDYLASTEPAGQLVDDLVFVFFSADGCHLWLLEEEDSSLVLLMRLRQPQFAPVISFPPEASRPITSGLEWLDVRTRQFRPGASVARIPPTLIEELTSKADPNSLRTSKFWISRMAAADSGRLSPSQLADLLHDDDPWVRRTAQIASGHEDVS